MTAVATPLLGPGRQAILRRRVRQLVAVTITYNIVEAVVAVTAGIGASSVALIGFGLDSTIEVASAATVAWQFSAADPESRERTALRVIAVSFFALAAYVTIAAARSLVTGAEAEQSTPGVVLAALSLAIMPVLSAAQRRTGRELGSASAVADSKQTLLCTYLSAVVLVGLALNATLGWSWADPLAGLVIAAIAVREGREAWRGENCCTPVRLVPTGWPGPGRPGLAAMSWHRRMPIEVREAMSREMTVAATAATSSQRWRALERVHILSQPWPWPHTVVHWHMLRLALRQRNRREALGQVTRLLLAAPGSVSGRYPAGNTGRATV